MSADPAADEWREVAAGLGALVHEHLRRVFEWIDAELATSGSHGAAALILALVDLDDGGECPMSLAIRTLLYAADAHMPCPHAAAAAAGR